LISALQTCSCEHRCQLASYRVEIGFFEDRYATPFISYVRENGNLVEPYATKMGRSLLLAYFIDAGTRCEERS